MFDRLEILIGQDNIKKIQDTNVLIIGLGGVGSYAAEAIARSGFLNITIVDNDIVDISNINRQLIALNSTIGKNKTDVMYERIKSINNNINIRKITEYINKDNISLLFTEKIDYIIDACDTIETKKELIRICTKKNIKLISSMGTANKLNPSKLEIIDIRKTSYDPIAKILRKMIKDEKIKTKIPVVCSTEVPVKNKKLGSNAFVPATAGLMCASYIINDIVGDIIDRWNKKNDQIIRWKSSSVWI